MGCRLPCRRNRPEDKLQESEDLIAQPAIQGISSRENLLIILLPKIAEKFQLIIVYPTYISTYLDVARDTYKITESEVKSAIVCDFGQNLGPYLLVSLSKQNTLVSHEEPHSLRVLSFRGNTLQLHSSHKASKAVVAMCCYSPRKLVVGHEDGFSVLEFDENITKCDVIGSDVEHDGHLLARVENMEMLVIAGKDKIWTMSDSPAPQECRLLGEFSAKSIKVVERMKLLFTLGDCTERKNQICVWKLASLQRLTHIDLCPDFQPVSMSIIPTLRLNGRIYVLLFTASGKCLRLAFNACISSLDIDLYITLKDSDESSPTFHPTNPEVNPINYYLKGSTLYSIAKSSLLPKYQPDWTSKVFSSDLELKTKLIKVVMEQISEDLGQKERIEAFHKCYLNEANGTLKDSSRLETAQSPDELKIAWGKPGNSMLSEISGGKRACSP